MADPQTVPMFINGELGDVPYDRMVEAMKAGAIGAVKMKSADGLEGYIPANRTQEAASSGMKIVPLEQQDTQHPGVWNALKEDLGEAGIGLLLSGPLSQGYQGIKHAAENIQSYRETGKTLEQRENERRVAEGRGLPYRVAAQGVEQLGVNVPGMEQSAAEGDVGGVIGHAAAVPVITAATMAAEAPLRGGVKVGQKVTPKQAAAAIGGTAGAYGGAHVPGYGMATGPLGAIFGAERGAALAERMLGERANKPIIPKPEPPLPSPKSGLTPVQEWWKSRGGVLKSERPKGPIRSERPPHSTPKPPVPISEPPTIALGDESAYMRQAAQELGINQLWDSRIIARANELKAQAGGASMAMKPAELLNMKATPANFERMFREGLGYEPPKSGEPIAKRPIAEPDIEMEIRGAGPEPTAVSQENVALGEAAKRQPVNLEELESAGKKHETRSQAKEDLEATGRTGKAPLPAGFEPVESSALRGWKYDPATREFESVTQDGRHYIHGDVSPEEAAAFKDAESKGRAWQAIRNNPLVAKVVKGERVPVKPAEMEKVTGEVVPKSKEGMGEVLKKPAKALTEDDLMEQLQESLRQARERKGK